MLTAHFASLRAAFAALIALFVITGCSTTADLGMPALPPLSDKYAAIVVDANDGSVLYEMDSQVLRHPASLTKMMTLYIMFDAIKAGQLQATTPIPVSAYAASRPPTKIGFKPGETLSTEEAILSLVVKSANDVATAVAEYFAGSEEQFAAMMNARARALGMSDTVFRNASGLPDSAQVTTARDMARLALALRRDHPGLYRYFANKDFVYRGRLIEGHNDLIGTMAGVDGLKTGYIRASGFNLATSVRRSGRSVVAVVMGGDTAKSRNAHMRQLLDLYLPRASVQRGS
ncbi:D-alanyl-D-alanine carboxypeptidase family protein [Pararhizobium haloflavum]|uniref:D-alanyl-D-alanine carboxypeptidase family protein n=1 Tax=Pararhizobium haloflavum TaxID=2037914 RepID=UPI000C194A66|nr:D-alanyl-D-alanine carboxypeptidase family protein [Pararhizobium haloflavum]